MTIYRDPLGLEYEVLRVSEKPSEVVALRVWMESHGLPRLTYPWKSVDPDDDEPFDPRKLRDHLGNTETVGTYIEPKLGELVIRNKSGEVLHANIGDPVIRSITHGDFSVVKEPAFSAIYTEVL